MDEAILDMRDWERTQRTLLERYMHYCYRHVYRLWNMPPLWSEK